MKDQFDKYENRLTAGEKESLWQDIVEPRDLERERKVQFWRGLGLVTGAVAVALAVFLIWDFGPHHTENFDRLNVAMNEPQTGETAMDKIREEIEDSVADDETYTAVADASKKDPAVAESGRTRQAAAAFNNEERLPLKGGAGDAAAAGTGGEREGAVLLSMADDADADAGESRDMTVLVLEPELVDSSMDSLQAGYGRICGKLINADTGDPLPFANVMIEGTKHGAMTEEDGTFCFDVPSGVHTLLTSYIGFETCEISNLLVGDQAHIVQDVAMNRADNLVLKVFMEEGETPIVDVANSTVRRAEEKKDLSAFATDNVQEALAIAPGKTFSGDRAHTRGGRTGEVSMQIDGGKAGEPTAGRIMCFTAPPSHPGTPDDTAAEETWNRDEDRPRERRHHGRCWWPPEADLPNGEPYDAMFFEHYGVNPFIVTEEDPQSTFAIDVDNASYTIARRYIEEGHLPPEEAIRVEEFVNAFDQGYRNVEEGDFAIRVDGAPSPFAEGYHLLRVSMQGREVTPRERKAANLVFVVDTSGSMARENRLGLVKRALGVLLDELDEADTVGIVEYGSRGRIVLHPTSVENRRRIEQAIRALETNGSTNAEEGLDLAYTMASKIEDPSVINRLILCSDGVANTGETEAERILDKVRYQSDRGIYLSTIGFGMGNYNDVLMEKLADKGDGNYYYVDDIDEANRVFKENLTGTLQTIARDAKIQVEFDPEHVLRYRLLGYENRDVADEDFRNDDVDAGEIGAGHCVTALYEVKLNSRAADRVNRFETRRGGELNLGVARLRYEYPRHDRKRAGEVVELEREIGTAQFSHSFDRSERHLRITAIVAEFAEILRGSFWARGSSLHDLDEMLDGLPRTRSRESEELLELRRLVSRAAELSDDDR